MSRRQTVHDASGIALTGGNGHLLAFGTTAPSDGAKGYAPGCIFVDVDASAGSTIYVNVGTRTSADFDKLTGGINLASLTATAAELNAAADVSARRIAIADGNYTILAANSGKPHIIADVSADRTFTLPDEADGLDFEFLPDLNAADGHDWIFTTGSDTNFFTGGLVHIDTDSDAAGDEVVLVAPDGNSNSKLQVNLPQPGTRVRFICNGTTWNVSGQVVSATAPAFADQ